jgi:hypothetical protein
LPVIYFYTISVSATAGAYDAEPLSQIQLPIIWFTLRFWISLIPSCYCLSGLSLLRKPQSTTFPFRETQNQPTINMLQQTLFPTLLLSLSSTISALALPNFSNILPRSSLTLPSSGLPDPSSISPSVSLKYVALGLGTQNYTCTSTPSSSSGVPVQVGAAATLSDATSFLQYNQPLIPYLPALVLGFNQLSAQVDANTLGLPFLGHHFFNGAGSPEFDLTAISTRLVAKKLATVSAPSNASPGPGDAGAVPWLQLGDNGAGLSFGGLQYVYRVETAGGSAPATCANQDSTFQVPYAAEYWFYG